MKRSHQIIALTLAALMLAATLAACGGSGKGYNSAATSDSKSEAVYDYEMPKDDIVMEDKADGGPIDGGYIQGPDMGSILENAKIIRRAELSMETQDFETTHTALAELVAELEGYFESRSVENRGERRHGYFTVRVPVAKFDEFCTQVGELCNLTNFYADDDNVSDEYYDVEARLATQRIKLERLQELLSRAELMEDIITIESAISETELQIEYLTGNLRQYDSLIDYGTIIISLNEVYVYTEEEKTPITFGERMTTAFSKGWENAVEGFEDLLVSLTYNWMTIIILCAVGGGVFVVVRRLRGRRRAKILAEREEMERHRAEEKKAREEWDQKQK